MDTMRHWINETKLLRGIGGVRQSYHSIIKKTIGSRRNKRISSKLRPVVFWAFTDKAELQRWNKTKSRIAQEDSILYQVGCIWYDWSVVALSLVLANINPLTATARLGMCDQPLQRYVDVAFFLAWDWIAANLSVLDGGQIPKQTDKHKMSTKSLMQSQNSYSHPLNESILIKCIG